MTAPPAPARHLHWPAVAVVALISVGALEIRRRDVNAALESSVDIVILVELGVFAAVAAFLFLTIARPPRRRRLPTVLVAGWVLVSILAFSALWAPSPTLAVVRGGQLVVTMALVTAIGRRASERDLALVAHVYVWVVTVWIAVGLVYRNPPAWNPPPEVTGRFTWLYTHPVVAGSLLVISVLFLAGWSGRRPGGPRFMSATAARVLLAVHLAALGATQTRGSIIAVVAGLAVLVWLRLTRHRRVDAVMLALLSAPIVVAASLPLLGRFLLRGGSTEQLRSLNSRTELWSDAVAEVSDSPLLGRGYFAAREIFLDSIGLGGAHNAYVEVAVSAGLLGLTAFVFLVLVLTRDLWRLRSHPQQPVLAGLLVAALVNGISAGYLAQAGTGANVMFLLVVGWVGALVHIRSQERHTPPVVPTR